MRHSISYPFIYELLLVPAPNFSLFPLFCPYANKETGLSHITRHANELHTLTMTTRRVLTPNLSLPKSFLFINEQLHSVRRVNENV